MGEPLPVSMPSQVVYPVHFSDWDKENLRPVKTSYYTAWLYIHDKVEKCRLEAWTDTVGMREARRYLYGKLPPKEGYEIQKKYEMECWRVGQENDVLHGRPGDPNVGFSAREIIFSDLMDHTENFLEKHIYKVVGGGLSIVTGFFLLAVHGQPKH